MSSSADMIMLIPRTRERMPKRNGRRFRDARSTRLTAERLVHAAHAAARRAAGRRLVFLLLDDERFRREEKSGDRRGVLQRRAGHLGRVDDAGLDQILVRVSEGVVTERVILRRTDL